MTEQTTMRLAPGSPDSAAATCIFHQDWWFEALCSAGNWGRVTVELGGKVQVSLPYRIERRFGFRILSMPPFTQSAGPVIVGDRGTGSRALAVEKDLYFSLIEALPDHDAFNQNFHSAVSNWLPWHWKGFEQSTRYSYRLDDLSDQTALWTGLMPNIRSDIKKARDRHHIRIHSDASLDKLLELNSKTFLRQGLKRPYSDATLIALDDACAKRKCRKIFFAEDPAGRMHAAIYLVWDEHSAYYLIGGSDPELRNSGATSLALWEAICFASTVTQSFDFEGSMIEPVERFFRGFGARQVPYFHIWRFNHKLLEIAYFIKKLSRNAL